MSRPAPLLLLASLLLAPSLLAGCNGAEKVRAERDRVSRKVEALRSAEDVDLDVRRKLLAELEKDATKDPLGMAARDTCASAYRALIESLTQSEEVEAAMKTGQRIDPFDMKRKLDAADKLIGRSEEDMPKCDKAASDLRTVKP